MEKSIFNKLVLEKDLKRILENKEIILVESREDILDLAMGRREQNTFEVSYETPGKGNVLEATVVRCKWYFYNYTEPYMRRRDPDCMVISDDKPTDKPTLKKDSAMILTNLETLPFNG